MSEIPILDTHLHLVYPEELSYPWLAGVPEIDRRWPVEAYFAEAKDLGIRRALHMEVAVAEADMRAETEFMLAIDPRVVGVVAACRPERGDFPAHLDWLTARPGVRGLRRILHTVPDALSQTAMFDDHLRRVGAAGLTFDLCLRPDQLGIGMAHARAATQTQFVLDHCGAQDATPEAFEAWRRAMTGLADLPNVAVKISGIVAYQQPDWTLEDIRPWIEHAISSFGWDRVVWGSDHPVCTKRATLTRWVEAARQIVAGASEDEQARLFHRNAERIYRVPPFG